MIIEPAELLLLQRAPEGAGFDRAIAALIAICDQDADECVGEAPRGSNRGPKLKRVFAADDYEPPGKEDAGYPWCASWVSERVQTWFTGCAEARRLLPKTKAPRTAGAFALQDKWAKDQPGVVVISGAAVRLGTHRVFPGDIIVFDFSHCGIAKTESKKGFFTCIEGNTDAAGSREGWQVARKVRGLSSLRGVLRFVPKGIPV